MSATWMASQGWELINQKSRKVWQRCPGNNNVRRCPGPQVISPELRMFYCTRVLKAITRN